MPDDAAPELGARAFVEQPVPGAVLVRVTGEVDYATATELRDALAEGLGQRPYRLVVDFAEVEFLGSAGLDVLVKAHVRTQAQRTAMVLVCPGRRVRRVLELSGLLELFTLAPSVEGALSGLPGPGSMSDAAKVQDP